MTMDRLLAAKQSCGVSTTPSREDLLLLGNAPADYPSLGPDLQQPTRPKLLATSFYALAL